MQEVAIRHGARMANRMLQYLTAMTLADGARISGYSIAEWSMEGPGPSRGHRGWPKIDVQRIDVPWLLSRISDGTIEQIKITESVCDIDLLPDPETAANVFAAPDEPFYPATQQDLVIHVRLEDIMVPGRHTGYGPLPLAWYREILEETGLRPVFIGQLSDDPYSNAIRQTFPDAVILEGGSVLHDFQTLRNAPHVALGVSTFSWLAAWLGEGNSIHYPLLGILNPSQEPGQNLVPAGDPRYQFYHFPRRSWMADEAALNDVIHGPSKALPIANEALSALLSNARTEAEPVIAAWRARVEAALG